MYWTLLDDERLVKALMSANTPHTLRDFLKDLMTEKELALFTKRLKAAFLLYDGMPYSHIERLTGLSPHSISRISKKLVDKKGGFQQIIKKLNPHGRRYFE